MKLRARPDAAPPAKLRRLRAPIPWRSALGLLLYVIAPDSLGAQTERLRPPRSPAAVAVPEIGRIEGTIRKQLISGSAERFGKEIWRIGDINNDGLQDWAVGRFRPDTLARNTIGEYVSERNPEEVLLYLGQGGQLPKASDGRRLGPTEILASTRLLGAGDFDGDGSRDLVTGIELLSDTAENNRGHDYSTTTIAVFWGNGTGRFDVADTTRLRCSGAYWLGVKEGEVADFDRDGVDDLILETFASFEDGIATNHARLRIFRGKRGSRWKSTVDGDVRPDWSMWYPSAPSDSRLSILDHDCDGAVDIAFDRRSGNKGNIGIYYGNRRGELPDTNDAEAISLPVWEGLATRFSDVTGDGAPELLVNLGSRQTVRIYAGRRGQRLIAQYGEGDGGPVAGDVWWRRPWAEIWTPERISGGWLPAGFGQILELGDISNDGIPEVWLESPPFVLAYRVQETVDSLADAWVRMSGHTIVTGTVLGDIDGSGHSTSVLYYDSFPADPRNPFPGGLLFLRGSDSVSTWGAGFRPLPHRVGEACAPLSSLVHDRSQRPAASTLSFDADYSDRDRTLQLRWNRLDHATGPCTLDVISTDGATLYTRSFDATRPPAVIDVSSWPRGAYLLRVTDGNVVASTKVFIG